MVDREVVVMNRLPLLLLIAAATFPHTTSAQTPQELLARVDALTSEIESKVVAWRRDIHQHPELGNREVRTAGIVADHLRSLGIETRTEVGRTGVVGVLRGGSPGPVVALRADMDALPVTEQVDLPFASTVRTVYNGQEVGVMHACGHDNHVAILMGVAEVLATLREELSGTVKFIFQPAEEGAPDGEEGGADLMLAEGAFDNPSPGVAFALHVGPGPLGYIGYAPNGAFAAADELRVVVRGRQTHAAFPSAGVDPIVTASQVVLGLQTIVSRQVNLQTAPAVVSIGMIQGGVRNNIIPDSVVMIGTIRTLDPEMREDIHRRVRVTAEGIATAAGATADVTITRGYPVTMNDPDLTAWGAPILESVAGEGRAGPVSPNMAAEDFSYFAQRVPGLMFTLGVTPLDQDYATAAPNHSPLFFADEAALPIGVKALAHLTVEYMQDQR
jgi:amidohydrolase